MGSGLTPSKKVAFLMSLLTKRMSCGLTPSKGSFFDVTFNKTHELWAHPLEKVAFLMSLFTKSMKYGVTPHDISHPTTQKKSKF